MLHFTYPKEVWERMLHHEINKTDTELVDKVPNRVIFQLFGHLKTRLDSNEMFVLSKGKTQAGVVIQRSNNSPSEKAINELTIVLKEKIINSFSNKPDMGKVWVDERLKGCPLPTQQRSSSKGLFEVARGTRFLTENPEKNYIRLFVYWIGRDIDLSATFHDKGFNQLSEVAYYNRSHVDTYFSGDITNAPKGASEFIDINIEQALQAGYRYVMMNVNVFSGPTFAEHEEVFAGWMTLDEPGKNDIYQPKQVKQKIDIVSDTKYTQPVAFDLLTREAIWMDIHNKARTSHRRFGINNASVNKITNEMLLKLMAEKAERSFNLYDLFSAHVEARGTFVSDKNEADIKIGFGDDCDITPYDVTTINSEYLA